MAYNLAIAYPLIGVTVTFEKEGLIIAAGGGGLAVAYWVIMQSVRLFQGERAQSEVLDGMRVELKRKDEELAHKEMTITLLVKEKAEQLHQLSEIPRLRDVVLELETQVNALASLLNHLITSGSSLSTEQQLLLLRLLSSSGSPENSETTITVTKTTTPVEQGDTNG